MRLSQTTVTDRLNKGFDCTDCGPVIREDINKGWVTVGASSVALAHYTYSSRKHGYFVQKDAE